ncbi:murein DD-endopeptidase MepM/ murein hydrolase activator NlpD [Paenibacillus baekrokdamisoli]|uniref:M23 family metallopeptidase n=1 Tax=Paenibacillus baekrokdamisoli TaxID=1712516 RepID=UPI0018050839|nr:M23 family metallopeptidase [Paenibacillus baekrokdamisoli]MBB3068580.1 murein DD-endopeptidase MepM/ murein hydrolase activator NlpD [Paenibacillus baekrokdamisoli]
MTPRWVHKKPITLAIGAIAALVIVGFSGNQYVKAHAVDFVQVYMNGNLVGEVASQDQVNQLISRKQSELKKNNPNITMVLETGTLKFEHKSAYKAKPASSETLQKLEGLFSAHAKGVELVVNGKAIGIVKDQATADAILKRVKGKYAPQTVAKKQAIEVTALAFSSRSVAANSNPTRSALKSVNFLEKVTTDVKDVQPTDILNADQVYLMLVKGTVKATKYTVQEGDCVGCIAHKFNISKQVIYDRNPWIQDDMIKVGDELDLTVLKPQVTVQTIENVTETVSIEPITVIQKNSNMRAGEQKLIRQGQSGKKKVVYRQVKQNGYLMSEELIGEQVLESTVPAIIMKGTKVILGEGSGNFAWPVSGARLTSGFGQRWGRMHKGVDLVGNSSILAADNGVVSFAGTKNGLGNCIIINHKNGYETTYGHLSKISVSEGQVVEKGDKIGVMGNTGHSFGTHLHFEVHKNGELQNPLKYL